MEYNLTFGNDNSTMFCSFTPETEEQQATLFNAMNNPDKKIADCVNEVINIKDFFVEVVEMSNQDGEIVNAPRIVLIDADGVTYYAISTGIYNAIRKLTQVYGVPTWEKPIPVKVKQIQRKERRIFTLEVVK